MEKREVIATVEEVKVKRGHDDRLLGYQVTLSNGWTYSLMSSEDVPRVGDRKLVTIEDDLQEQLDLSDMRAAVIDFGSRTS